MGRDALDRGNGQSKFGPRLGKSFGASGCWARDWMLTLGLSSHTVDSSIVTTRYFLLRLYVTVV